jgi:glycosyltransferase involved in cell wall biosynthesis
MKILHIIAGDLSSGASRGALWLHKALRESGIDSKVLISGKVQKSYDDINGISNKKVDQIKIKVFNFLSRIPIKIYRKRSKNIFSTGLFGYDFTENNEYDNADIIHMHWVNGGLLKIKNIEKINKPIVWTVRDMWPFTGGCHYSLGCKKYLEKCGACNELGSSLKYDLSSYVYNKKKKYYRKEMIIIGISNWLSEQIKQSSLLSENEIHTIHNNIDTKIFKNHDSDKARKKLGIKSNKKIILCGAINLENKYKGLTHFIEAIQYLDSDKYLICFFGDMKESIKDSIDFETIFYNRINDDVTLNTLYTAADVFVSSSIQEAFGKTIIEAQSSGTPVVCFNATGPSDLVIHKETGYKAIPYSSRDFAHGIEWVLENNKNGLLSKKAREYVVNNFDSKIISKKYIRLYRKILNVKEI